MNLARLQALARKPTGEEIILKPGAKNSDIQNAIHSMAGEATADVEKLAHEFKEPTAERTAFKIWYFLRTRGKYVRDSNERQQIRFPRRLLFDTIKKNNSGDCKSFSLFTISILRALGMPAYLRYAGYIPGKQQPSHVYAYTTDANGREIIIDGCYPFFNREKKYTFVENKDMTVSALGSISTNSDKARKFLQNLKGEEKRKFVAAWRRRKAALLKAAKMRGLADDVLADDVLSGGVINDYQPQPIAKKLSAEQKAKRKAKAKKGGKKFLWGIAFIHLAPIRGAFTAILAMNINGLASNMKFVYDNRNSKTKEAWAKLSKIWKNVGGLPKALTKGMELGAKHKPLFLSKKAKKRFEKKHKGLTGIWIGDAESLGNPAIIAAAVAAASGIIAAMIPPIMTALKKNGKGAAAEDMAQQGQELVQEAKGGQLQQDAAQGAEIELEEPEGVGAADWGALTEALGEVAKVGITAAGNAVAKKVSKNPKAKRFLEKAGEGADDYLTGRYLRQSGYKDAAKSFTSGSSKILLYGGLAAAGLLGIFLITKRK